MTPKTKVVASVPSAGSRAPDFQLIGSDGKEHRLSDYRGKNVVLYFYPKDMTPGCTVEACSFRDGFHELQQRGVTVLGISTDSVDSHKKFQEKYHLPFVLLSDADKTTVKRYRVWVKKKLYGREYFGISRTTFLIDAAGNIQNVFEKVNPETHYKEIISSL